MGRLVWLRVMLCWFSGLSMSLGSVGEFADGEVFWGVVALVSGLGLVGLGWVYWLTPGGWSLPDWARRFEVRWQPHGAELACNRCDQVVLPVTRRVTLPRVLAYAHQHAEDICGRATALTPGVATDALALPSKPRWRPGR